MSDDPVAWLYEGDDGSKELILDCNGEYARRLLELGYTETPLYAHRLEASRPSTDEEFVPVGGEAERAEIAAWLRKCVNENWQARPYDKALRAEALSDAAAAIERGDHKK